MFKEKSSKKRIVTSESAKDHSTLDARHQQTVQNLQDRQAQLEELKDEKIKLQKKLDECAEEIKQYKLKGDYESNAYHELWNKNLLLKERMVLLNETLRKIETYEDEIEYYENTGYILFKYYDLLQKQDEGVINPSSIPSAPSRLQKGRKKQAPIAGISILDAFGISDKNKIDEDNEKDEDDNGDITDKNNDNKTKVDKSSLVDEYLSCIDANYLRNVCQDALGNCTKCAESLICLQQDGIMVCPSCGYQELLLVEQNRPIIRQCSKESSQASHYSYKRINHFREWCSQVQGKESTDIPDDVFEQILQEIKKQKISDTKKITYNKMREILKKLKIHKYYEHINYIINRINGVPTPHFPPELEEKLCNMFKEIQGPFLRHCPKHRKNFLSYSYVLSCFFRILGMDEYLKYFPLLKSREKLYAQDQIFKAICEDLGWPFYPSL